MGLRGWALVGLLVAGVGWWYSPLSPRVPKPPQVVMEDTALPADSGRDATPESTAFNPACLRPERVSPGMGPLQSSVPSSFPALRIENAALRPLAGFSVQARVLSRQDYGHGREAEYSPTDLALGWNRMREDAVLSQLDIDQSSRWYHYRWRNAPPLPVREIVRSSANMHMVPSDAATATALRRVRKGEELRIDGWLVEIRADDGWTWRSSLTRDDTGAGACEVVYVCGITLLRSAP